MQSWWWPWANQNEMKREQQQRQRHHHDDQCRRKKEGEHCCRCVDFLAKFFFFLWQSATTVHASSLILVADSWENSCRFHRAVWRRVVDLKDSWKLKTEDDNEEGFISVLTAAKITHTHIHTFNVIMQTGGAVCYDKTSAAAATTTTHS